MYRMQSLHPFIHQQMPVLFLYLGSYECHCYEHGVQAPLQGCHFVSSRRIAGSFANSISISVETKIIWPLLNMLMIVQILRIF